MNKFKTAFFDEASEVAVQAAADLPTERTSSGSPILTFKGVRLHSQYDPFRESLHILDSQRELVSASAELSRRQQVTLLVCGAGLGFMVSALAKRISEASGNLANVRVVCVEKEPEIARKALQLNVWEPADVEVSWLVGDNLRARLQARSDNAPIFYLECGASYRMNRAVYDSLRATSEHPRPAERPMRILVPTPLYGGSYPAALHCAAAFRRLGHQVEELDLSVFYENFKYSERVTGNARHVKQLQGLLTTYLGELIVARALSWKADLVWAVAQTPLTPSALDELRHEGIHSALWFVEDYALFGYWRELAPRFDAVFTIQRGTFHDHLLASGVTHIYYLPCAANEELHFPREMSPEDRARYGSRVSFVGAGYPNRRLAFERLDLRNFKIWGSDWPEHGALSRWLQEGGRRVSTEETACIYSATDINLNLHSSTRHVGVNPDGDFVNPRTFEIAACGGFQLVDHRSELAELFEYGKEVVVFRNLEELPDLIEYYLQHDRERETIATAGRQRVLRNHTYVHRMTSALDYLESNFPRLADRRRGPNYVASLKSAVEDDPELTSFLSQFSDDEELDLDKIVSRIEIGNRKLSRAEGIFLLMKEFRDWGRSKGVIA